MRRKEDGMARRTHPIGRGGLVVLALLAAAGCATTSGPGDPLDLDGAAVDPLADPGASAVVILFTCTDCPISNRYAPEVRRLHERFAPDGIRFWLVYPDPGETPDAIRAHLADYAYAFGALRDTEHALVERAGADVTPEAAVFMPDGTMVYRGRIDDRFVDFGKTRARATTHDLEDVLATIVAGKPVIPRTTRAVGCFIPDLPTS
jgi:hypothetical protein